MIEFIIAWLLIGTFVSLLMIIWDLIEGRMTFTKQNMITIAIMICFGFAAPVIFLYFLWKGWSR